MFHLLFRGLIAGAVVVGVSELSKRSPRLGALMLTLPIISIVAIVLETGGALAQPATKSPSSGLAKSRTKRFMHCERPCESAKVRWSAQE